MAADHAGPPLSWPLAIGAWQLRHRVVLAPMNRLRADLLTGVPTAEMARYYADRTTPGGLLIAEASAISQQGTAQAGTPGLYTPEHVNAWRSVTTAVHDRGGFILAQLWHAGRLAGTSVSGEAPVGASPIVASGRTYAPAGSDGQLLVPQALDDDGIDRVIDQYRRAAENAGDAGFDGIELHCASGCLIDQFLQASSNIRGDAYGGSIESRVHFLVDAVQAVMSVWNPNRVGVRLSPLGAINDVDDPDPVTLFRHVLQRLDEESVTFVHLMEPRAGAGVIDVASSQKPEILPLLRTSWPMTLVASGGFDSLSANKSIARGDADAISFGRAFLANADLAQRLVDGRCVDSVGLP